MPLLGPPLPRLGDIDARGHPIFRAAHPAPQARTDRWCERRPRPSRQKPSFPAGHPFRRSTAPRGGWSGHRLRPGDVTGRPAMKPTSAFRASGPACHWPSSQVWSFSGASMPNMRTSWGPNFTVSPSTTRKRGWAGGVVVSSSPADWRRRRQAGTPETARSPDHLAARPTLSSPPLELPSWFCAWSNNPYKAPYLTRTAELPVKNLLWWLCLFVAPAVLDRPRTVSSRRIHQLAGHVPVPVGGPSACQPFGAGLFRATVVVHPAHDPDPDGRPGRRGPVANGE